jgi:hypothetical protein
MKKLHAVQSSAGRPSASLTANSTTRRTFLVGCLIAGLFVSLLPLRGAHASGVFWLPTQQASDPSFDHLNPVLAS